MHGCDLKPVTSFDAKTIYFSIHNVFIELITETIIYFLKSFIIEG